MGSFVALSLTMAVAGQSVTATTPRPLNAAEWVYPDDYPPAALRAEEEGRLRLDVAVDPTGRVTSCTVTESSGSANLDAATCPLITARARFAAATDAGGKAVAGVYRGSIRWVIPEPDPVPLADWTIDARMSVASNGLVLSCTNHLTGPVLEGDSDPCRTFSKMPPAFGLQLRGAQGGSAPQDVTMRLAMRRSNDTPAVPAGWTMTSISRVVFAVAGDGSIRGCETVEVTGIAASIPSPCTYGTRRFVPDPAGEPSQVGLTFAVLVADK